MAKSKREQITQMNVSPAKAEKWLEEANIGNRSLSIPHVERLARDMKAGAWGDTPEPIAFDSNGRLIDGQHRLAAVVKSGVTICFWVATNCHLDAQKYLDAGRRRSLADAYGFYMGDSLGKRAEAITKAMMDCRLNYGYTRRQEADFYKKHKDAISFAERVSSGTIAMPDGARRKIPAGVAAVIGRASYTQDNAMLERFCDSLRTGISSSKSDIASQKLREELMFGAGKQDGPAGRRWFYRRSEYLLDRFLKRSRTVKRGEVAPRELYPIPGEDDYVKLAIAS